jgi:THO complex subunit 1
MLKDLSEDIPVDDRFGRLNALLDLAWGFSREETLSLDPSVPLSLAEDAMDILPIAGVGRLFAYLESRLPWITEGLVPGRGKALILLRLCNEALRSLSRTEDAQLCGRIQTFLASVFPLSERSGVNLKGEYHTDNVTLFDGADEVSAMDVDSQGNCVFPSFQ